jgi:hypothetical protein
MKRNRFKLPAIALVLLGMVSLSQLQAEDDPQTNQNVPETVDAAKSAFETIAADYALGQASVEDMYQWSRRLMEAELAGGTNKKAVLDHVARMRTLFEKVAGLHKIQVKGGSAREFQSTRYYLLAAQGDALKQAK